MGSFLKIASGMLLPLSLALAGTGCMALSGDEEADDETIAEAALPDETSTTTTPQDANCGGPGNLIGSLPYPLPPIPAYYGGSYFPGFYGGAPYFGGATPYYGGSWPGYSGYWGAGYGGNYYNPGYYNTPGAPGAGCGCPPPP